MNPTCELISRYYSAFNAGDITGMLDCLADDVQHFVNQGERRVGKAKFAEFCARSSGCYHERLEDIVVMRTPDGRRAAAEFVVYGTYNDAADAMPEAHGQAYALSAGAFFDIADGRIARITTYYNLNDWIDQVSR